MVKVQKPLPKTLNKFAQKETFITKKKAATKPIKPSTASKSDATTPVVAAKISTKPKSKETVKEKKVLLSKTVIEGNVVTPAKNLDKKVKQQKGEDKAKKVPLAENTKKVKEAKKNVKDVKESKVKGPLVLAPVITPVKTTTKSKVSKKQNINEKEKEKKVLSDTAEKPLTKQEKKKAAIRAYKKQKREKKAKGNVSAKGKVPRAFTYEPTPFDEEKFNEIVCVENVTKVAKALKTVVMEEVKKQKTSIFSDYRYFLNVASFKIASCPHRMVKVGLKHSLVQEGDDVALIVADLQRGAKVDYEPTKQHYEDLLRENGIDNVKVIPFNQLRNEMKTFESKRKFCNTYDYFLCDGRIVGQAHGFLGIYTQKPRSTLHAVRLHNCKDLKKEIRNGLHRSAFRQQMKGDLVSIPIGNHTFTAEQVAENAVEVAQQLKKLHPGGPSNIRSMNLKIDIKGTSSLPLYVNMGMPPAETPYVVGPREQRMLKLKRSANEALSKFTLTKDAKLIKLNEEQVERKRQIREARNAIKEAEDQPQDDDGEDTVVPAKKPRKEEKVIEKDLKKKDAGVDEDDEEEEDEAGDDDDDDEEVEGEDDNEDGEGDEDDDDDDDENENEEAEAEDSDENAEANSDENEEDDSDEGDDDDEDEDDDDDE